MKNILIFTLPTGQGHNQVAESVKDMFPPSSYHVKIANPLDEKNYLIQKIVKNGYLFMAGKTPSLYSNLYNLSNKENFPTSFNRVFKKNIESTLKTIISSFKPDLIISTHPLLNESLSNIKKAKESSFHLIGIITDYVPHRSYIAEEVDGYITGTKETGVKLIACGVPPSKIFPYGIPISNKFLESNSSKSTSDSLNILIMGGGMGMGLTQDIIMSLLNLDSKLKFHIVCGKNKKLYKNLATLIKNVSLSSFSLYSYTEEIPRLMNDCDVLISKPGGVTFTEALVKNTPIIMPYVLPGQEEENADFIVKNKIGIRTHSNEELKSCLLSLLSNEHILPSMKNNMLPLASQHSMKKTKELFTTLLFSEKKEAKKKILAS